MDNHSVSAETTTSCGNQANVVVAVRVRPLSAAEVAGGAKPCCQIVSENVLAIRKAGDAMQYLKSQQLSVNEYAFDAVLDERASQREVYARTAQPFIARLLDGQNVTVFAYGATGAGKTHTMLGNTRADETATRTEAGIIPQAVQDVFLSLQRRRRERDAATQVSESAHVYLSFLEVYNEQVYDLLDGSGANKVLSLREDQERGVVVVAGITEQRVASYEQVIELVLQGNKRRKTEATLANEVSSRSHAVLQLVLRQFSRHEHSGKEICTESKLSLIDLAGSERASATNNRGVRLQEGANINKSLLALANCINALAENSSHSSSSSSSTCSLANGVRRGAVNVKYRDSKLTHLLKSSLEGNCNLVMIANINPSDATYEDSHNTLKYANRAKNIKVNPLVKESARLATERDWVEREMRLREENSTLKKIVRDLERQVHELQRFKNAVMQNAGMLPEDYIDIPMDSSSVAPRVSDSSSGSFSTLGEAELDSSLSTHASEMYEDTFPAADEPVFLPKRSRFDIDVLPPSATPAPSVCVAPAGVTAAARKKRVSLMPTPAASSSSSSVVVALSSAVESSVPSASVNARRQSSCAVPVPRENNYMSATAAQTNANAAKNPFEAMLATKNNDKTCRSVTRRRSTRLSLSAAALSSTAINLASAATPHTSSSSSSAAVAAGGESKVLKKARLSVARGREASASPVKVFESPLSEETEREFEALPVAVEQMMEEEEAEESPSKKRKSCTTTRRKSMAKVAAMLDSLAQEVTVDFDFAAKFGMGSIEIYDENNTSTAPAPKANTEFVGISAAQRERRMTRSMVAQVATPSVNSSKRKSFQPPSVKGKGKQTINNENVVNFAAPTPTVVIDL